ncbi:MAG: RsiV family protein, partial [Niameybacter sp.]
EYKDYFFEDYQQHIKELLTENTWYLSDEGFVIISNEYIISPHVVGILEFTIPYDQFQYLKPEYRPQ